MRPENGRQLQDLCERKNVSGANRYVFVVNLKSVDRVLSNVLGVAGFGTLATDALIIFGLPDGNRHVWFDEPIQCFFALERLVRFFPQTFEDGKR